jgi:predicted DsbA family dithiol-disulfide isomerase
MAFVCLPEQEVIPRFLAHLKANDGRTMPVPERMVELAEQLGVPAQDYMACVNDESKWAYYMGHTNFMEYNIGRGHNRRVFIHGMANNFRADYLRGFMDFLYNTPDFKRASLLKRNLASDIIIGEPSPNKVRLTIYMAPDANPERNMLAKYLQKYIQVYVNSGQAYVVIRMFNWYRPSSEIAARFMYCVPKDYKMPILEQMYASMHRWKLSENTDPSNALLDIASFNRLPRKRIEACLKSPRTKSEVDKERQAAFEQLKIVVTPVLYFNDDLFHIGGVTFAQLMQEMNRLEAIRTLRGGAER